MFSQCQRRQIALGHFARVSARREQRSIAEDFSWQARQDLHLLERGFRRCGDRKRFHDSITHGGGDLFQLFKNIFPGATAAAHELHNWEFGTWNLEFETGLRTNGTSYDSHGESSERAFPACGNASSQRKNRHRFGTHQLEATLRRSGFEFE